MSRPKQSIHITRFIPKCAGLLKSISCNQQLDVHRNRTKKETMWAWTIITELKFKTIKSLLGAVEGNVLNICYNLICQALLYADLGVCYLRSIPTAPTMKFVLRSKVESEHANTKLLTFRDFLRDWLRYGSVTAQKKSGLLGFSRRYFM